MLLAYLTLLLVAAQASNNHARITNGSPVVAGSNPDVTWQVYFVSGNSACGGSIIDENYILTAAHCVRSLSNGGQVTTSTSQMTVRPGIRANSGQPTKTISSMWIHPSYTRSTSSSNRVDMAILKLTSPLTFTTSVKKIALAASSCPVCETSGATYVVSGYGNTVSNSDGTNTSPSTSLLYATQTFVSKSACQAAAPFSVPVSTVCAGDPANTGKDSCTGDSGGPLALNVGSPTTPDWVLVGVVQSGTTVLSDNKPICGSNNEYGIYTSVMSERAWIDSVVAGTAGAPSDSSSDSSGGGSSGGGGILLCFHEESLISYRGGEAISMHALAARQIPECLVPHTIVSSGVRIQTDCYSDPLRLSNEHLVFSRTQGLVQAQRLRVGDVVFGDEAETRTCNVIKVTPEHEQRYMGLNCRHSVVLANGIKCSTFEAQHWIPSMWMKYVPSVLGLERASRVGEFLTNLGRSLRLV